MEKTKYTIVSVDHDADGKAMGVMCSDGKYYGRPLFMYMLRNNQESEFYIEDTPVNLTKEVYTDGKYQIELSIDNESLCLFKNLPECE